MEHVAHVAAYLDSLGTQLAPSQEQQFLCYRRQLLEWNELVNLTTITGPEHIERYHFVDSLTVAGAVPHLRRSGGRVCDVGSGAGFPGIPLKIVFPSLQVTLIDPSGKRTSFLEHLVAALGLEGVEIVRARAEEAAHHPSLRESFDVVVSRAVARLAVLAEYTLPFCRIGGRVALHKKGDIQEELGAGAVAVARLGGAHAGLVPIGEEVLDGARVLVVLEKAQPTPDRFPRRVGVPSRRPL